MDRTVMAKGMYIDVMGVASGHILMPPLYMNQMKW